MYQFMLKKGVFGYNLSSRELISLVFPFHLYLHLGN